MMNADDFKQWQELGAGDEDRMLAPIGSVAQHLGVPPKVVVLLALGLKRQSNNQHGRPRWWINGVPYFDMGDVARMEVLVKRADAIETSAGGN
jgi:hypothetical protein